MSTGPLNPAVGVNVYVPSAFMVNVPCAELGPVTTLAVKAAPVVFESFVNNEPVAGLPATMLL